MVTGPPIRARRGAPPSRRRYGAASGVFTLEAIVALGILFSVVVPISFYFLQEQKLCRAYYYRAVAMEIVDGEMEYLMAGEWRAYAPGAQAYRTTSQAATNLPPGKFVLNIAGKDVQLEWVPAGRGSGTRVTRKATLP